MKDTTKQKLKTEIKRFIKFFICTELAWLVDLGIFTLLFELIGLDYILCKAVSYTCGAITSYTLNKKLTFMDANPVMKTVPRFVITNLCALTASLTSMHLFRTWFAFSEWLCYMCSVVFSFSTNFLGNRFWVFRETIKNARKK